jgi:hypothetical protein
VPDSNLQVAFATDCFQDSVLIRPDDFRLRAAGVGIEPTSRRSERPILPLDDPAIVSVPVPGVGIEPTDSCDQRCASVPESGITINSDDPGIVFCISRVPCESWTRLASLEGWHLGRSVKGTHSGRRGSRTLKAGYPRSGWLDCFRDSCHRQLACPSVRELRRQELNLRHYAFNRRAQLPAVAPPQSSRRSWI